MTDTVNKFKKCGGSDHNNKSNNFKSKKPGFKNNRKTAHPKSKHDGPQGKRKNGETNKTSLESSTNENPDSLELNENQFVVEKIEEDQPKKKKSKHKRIKITTYTARFF